MQFFFFFQRLTLDSLHLKFLFFLPQRFALDRVGHGHHVVGHAVRFLLVLVARFVDRHFGLDDAGQRWQPTGRLALDAQDALGGLIAQMPLQVHHIGIFQPERLVLLFMFRLRIRFFAAAGVLVEFIHMVPGHRTVLLAKLMDAD